MKISIGTWAYTIGPYTDHPVGFDEVITRVKSYGFDGVELGAFPPHPNPKDLSNKKAREEIVDKLQSCGLSFSGLAADLWSEHLIDTDDHAHYIANFKSHCKFAVDLGIRIIRVDSVQPPTVLSTIPYEVALERVITTWQTCCDIASDYGLTVTWEAEPGFAFNKVSDIVSILEAVDKDNFGFLYDTCHAQMMAVVGARQIGEKEIYNNQLELLRMIRGKINHIHLIDSDNTCHKDNEGNDETSSHVPFGKGLLDFDVILPELMKAEAPLEWWTIDLCFLSNAWDITEQCKKYVDQLNTKYG